MASQKVCPQFLEFLCAFGSRTEEIHDIREGYYKSASPVSRSVKLTKLGMPASEPQCSVYAFPLINH